MMSFVLAYHTPGERGGYSLNILNHNHYKQSQLPSILSGSLEQLTIYATLKLVRLFLPDHVESKASESDLTPEEVEILNCLALAA